jgi:hypothetical protein
MWTGDPRAYERYWTLLHDLAGEWLIVLGGSFYPNLDTAEAFAIVNHNGNHRSIRAFRRLGQDRLDLRVGPLHPTIVRGMREWRFELDDIGCGLTLDFAFVDATRQIFRGFPDRSNADVVGRRADVTVGFESFGDVSGWVAIDGERTTITANTWRGTRDRHWGVGRSVGGPRWQIPGSGDTSGHSGNNFVVFSDWALWGDRIFYQFGDPRPRYGRVRKVERRLRFDPDTKLFVEGEIDYTLEDGQVRTLHYQRMGNQIAFLRCGREGCLSRRLRGRQRCRDGHLRRHESRRAAPPGGPRRAPMRRDVGFRDGDRHLPANRAEGL